MKYYYYKKLKIDLYLVFFINKLSLSHFYNSPSILSHARERPEINPKAREKEGKKKRGQSLLRFHTRPSDGWYRNLSRRFTAILPPRSCLTSCNISHLLPRWRPFWARAGHPMGRNFFTKGTCASIIYCA